jgi:transcriptional regulator PpsR
MSDFLARSMPTDPAAAPDFSALSPWANEVAQAMAQVASDIALVIDPDGVIRNVAAGTSPLPADCGRWVGRRWVDTVSADTRRKIELLLDELRGSAVTQRREVSHPIADGDDVPMAWTAIRLGEHGPVVAVGRDLRSVAAIQRRFLDAQHEMELDYWQRRHADNRYRTLFQVASDAVMLLDAHTLELLETNEAARELLRQPGATPASGSLVALWPEGSRPSLAELLATARGTGRAGEIRLRLRSPGPSWDVSATPFRVAERQQLLVRARRQGGADGGDGVPSMVRSLVESTPDAVVVTDSGGHVLMANPAFVALVQQSTEAGVKGRTLAEVVGDRDGAWREAIDRTRLHGLCPRTPLRVTHGALDVAVEVASTLLADGEQERLGFTLRAVEPPRPSYGESPHDGWSDLSALRAQDGLVPLNVLVREGADSVERQLIRTALRLGAGHVEAAARLLQLEPGSLSRRMLALEMSGNGSDDDAAAPQPAPRIN